MPTDAPKLSIKLRPDQVAGLKRAAAARGVEAGSLIPEIVKGFKASREPTPVQLNGAAGERAGDVPSHAELTGEQFVRAALDWWLALPQNRPA